MDIYLKFSDLEIKIPVLPESFEISTKQNNETVQIVAFGDLLLKGGRGLKSLSFSSFFPASAAHAGYTVQAKFKEPFALCNAIEKRKDSRQTVRLIITETNINAEFLIDEFSYGQEDATGDVGYTISMTEYPRPKVTVTKNGQKALSRQRGQKTTEATTYTVRQGDTLKSIAKKFFGSSKKFTTLALLNHIEPPYKVTEGTVILIR